ncbi:MAG: zf-TFIIB domain-containing protein [Anaerolineae bacterium]
MLEGIEVDRCTDCQGIWFDLQEHQQLKQLPRGGGLSSAMPIEDGR